MEAVRQKQAEYPRERLVNYLMTCEKDSLWKCELADATQYQATCQDFKLPSVGTLPPWECKKWKPSHCTDSVSPQHHRGRDMPISFFITNDWWETRLRFSFFPLQSLAEGAWWQGVIFLSISLLIVCWGWRSSRVETVNFFWANVACCFCVFALETKGKSTQ